MAVDPKTGKPVVVDAGWGEIARDLAGAFSRIRPPSPAEEARFYGLFGLPAPEPPPGPSPPDAEPRGVSPVLGAYGPWLAAQEWTKAEAKRQP
jgi:hypothetical protein